MRLKLIYKLLIASMMLLIYSTVTQAETLTQTITVSGLGEIQVEPDTVWINSGVNTKAETAQQALSENNAKMESVIDAFLSADIDKENIQTSGFNVHPVYDYSKNLNPPNLIGYQVNNAVRVKLTEIDKLGELLDSIIKSGSNQISGLHFGFDNDQALLDKARVQAIVNARKKADLYADAADLEVGDVISINEISATISQPRIFSGAGMAQARMANDSAVPVMGGKENVSANVTVVFQLKD